MDKYVKLLKKSKDRRIFEILEETENFLWEIGMKVVENKGKSGMQDMIKLMNMKKEGEYDVTKSSLSKENYNKIYYEFTHTNKEVIEKQPSILVGGTLKKY